MSGFTDDELYERGCATLVASWEVYARGSRDASVQHRQGVAIAVFPREPERAVYNNAVLTRDLGPHERARSIAAMEAVYAQAGVDRFAAWVHEADEAMRTDIESRAYALETATRAMGLELIHLPDREIPDIELGTAQWSEYVRYEGLPSDFLAAADHSALRLRVIREADDIVAAALAYDFGTDCGIYNVGTVERARRRGLGTAVTLGQLYAARARGCRTASLQSTAMAQRLYSRLGFRDLGQILEYVPAQS
jgi:ribosomal protein S18 acetylase RimI-like enzyme